MSSSLQSLIRSGTKLWLDSVDPDLVVKNHGLGATGATSNPIIIADLLKSGRFDADLAALLQRGLSDDAVAWTMTDRLVAQAEAVFQSIFAATKGNDGYVSFEIDPLLEDVATGLAHTERVRRYVELGRQWSEGHPNRLIKVPATPAGLGALEELASFGIPLNVTLIFSKRQYHAARDAVWKGAQRRGKFASFKSVYSIFVSRLDVYSEQHVPTLSVAAQGLVGILNAKEIWAENQDFWRRQALPLHQEIVFASTGTKKPNDPPWKYVAAFAGSDIETNPPGTNDAVAASGRTFERDIDRLPPPDVIKEIHEKVDFAVLESTLMTDGLKKFADPQKDLLKLVAEKRRTL